MSTQETPSSPENPPAVVSSQPQAPAAKNLGEAVREAKARKTTKKNTSRTTKSGGVRYIPGQSCIQVGQKHDFVRRTAKGGRQYDVCAKCGSSKMVREETDKTAKTQSRKTPAKPESSPANVMYCSTYFSSRGGKMLMCDRPAQHEGRHSRDGVD